MARYLCLWVQITALLTFSFPASALDLVNGESLYLIHCSGCHGEKGVSANPEVPNFSRGEQLFQPDSDLINVVRDGKNSSLLLTCCLLWVLITSPMMIFHYLFHLPPSDLFL